MKQQLLFIFLLLPMFFFGQEKTDSLVGLYNNLRDTFYVSVRNNKEVYLTREEWEKEPASVRDMLALSMYHQYRDKLFVGVYNPVQLVCRVPGCAQPMLTISSGLIISTGNNTYRVIVGFEPAVEISIFVDGGDGQPKLIGRKRFEVLTLSPKMKRAVLADAGLPVEQSGNEMVPKPEIPPKYKEHLNNLMIEALKYPMAAWRNDVQGRVTVRFLVNAGGFVKEVELDEQSPVNNNELFEELKRLLFLSSGKWFPALHRGLPVSTWHTLTVRFSIVNTVPGITVE